jgi:predicted membrane chloride channel (bestrophin family)
MDEHPPSLLQKIAIVIATMLVGLVIVAGFVAAVLSVLIEFAQFGVETLG